MTGRQEAIRKEFADLEEAKAEANEAEEEFKAQIADARHEAARIREEAREQGAAIIAEMREQAQTEANRIVEHAHAQIAGRAPAGARPRCAPRSAPWRPRSPVGSWARASTTTSAAAGSSTASSPTSRRWRPPRRRPARTGPADGVEAPRRRRWPTSAGCSTGPATLDDAAAAGEELFGVARPLRSEPALRRVATDTSVEATAKAGPGRAASSARPSATSRSPWSPRRSAAAGPCPRDLPDVIEQLGVVALVRSAGARRRPAHRRAVRARPADRGQPRAARRAGRPGPRRPTTRSACSTGCSTARCCPATLTLVEQARRPAPPARWSAALADYQQVAADVAGRAARHGPRRPASSPTPTATRLSEAWDASTAATVHLNVVVDPTWSAGCGSRSATTSSTAPSSSRLDDARRRLAG